MPVNTHLRLLVKDPNDEDDPGNEVYQAIDVKTVPREFEIVQYAGNKYRIIEGGVLWNFTEDGMYATLVAEAIDL